MRINVYSQELLLDERPSEPVTEQIVQRSSTGASYVAVRLFLDGSPRLHQPPKDDDRSAITFWLPTSEDRRERLAQQFDELARLVRDAARREWAEGFVTELDRVGQMTDAEQIAYANYEPGT